MWLPVVVRSRSKPSSRDALDWPYGPTSDDAPSSSCTNTKAEGHCTQTMTTICVSPRKPALRLPNPGEMWVARRGECTVSQGAEHSRRKRRNRTSSPGEGTASLMEMHAHLSGKEVCCFIDMKLFFSNWEATTFYDNMYPPGQRFRKTQTEAYFHVRLSSVYLVHRLLMRKICSV